MNVAEIRESKLAVCDQCGGALIPTPSGKWSRLKMCGPLKSITNEDSQKLALVVFGECRAEDMPGAPIDKQWAEFIRSLPAAERTEQKGRVVWMINGKPHKKLRCAASRDDIGPKDICAVLTPRTQLRVAILTPVESEAKS